MINLTAKVLTQDEEAEVGFRTAVALSKSDSTICWDSGGGQTTNWRHVSNISPTRCQFSDHLTGGRWDPADLPWKLGHWCCHLSAGASYAQPSFLNIKPTDVKHWPLEGGRSSRPQLCRDSLAQSRRSKGFRSGPRMSVCTRYKSIDLKAFQMLASEDQLLAKLKQMLPPVPSWLQRSKVTAIGGPNSMFCVASEALGEHKYTPSAIRKVLFDVIGKTDDELLLCRFCQGCCPYICSHQFCSFCPEIGLLTLSKESCGSLLPSFSPRSPFCLLSWSTVK